MDESRYLSSPEVGDLDDGATSLTLASRLREGSITPGSQVTDMETEIESEITDNRPSSDCRETEKKTANTPGSFSSRFVVVCFFVCLFVVKIFFFRNR